MALKILREFIKIESASGIILIISALLALVFANSPLQTIYQHILNDPITINVAGTPFSASLLLAINDGLMAIFFLLVSLEIKRELLIGELNTRKKALLPGIGAIGGMLCPALIFFLFNHSHREYYPGWAIPTATDIAFSLGVLALAGSKVPTALKSFLMALAILDDLGAIIIIAIFYTQHINFNYLLLSLLVIGLLALTNYLQIRRFWPYGILGIILWLCLMHAGVHATIAGVITGFAIPLTINNANNYSPLRHLEHQLHPWVAYGVMPLFALANAGLTLTNIHLNTFSNPLVLGIALGLFIGKQLGVISTSWLAIKCNIAQLPANTTWLQLYGVACLCGIGFTMSLFIGTLAFGEQNNTVMELIRLGVFSSSCLAGIFGFIVIANKPSIKV